MSWTEYIVKFENREMVRVEWQKAVDISRKYGELVPSDYQENLFELKMKNPFGVVIFHGSEVDGVSMISIDRPSESELIRPFIFDYLTTFDMVLCDQNFTTGVSAKNLSEHIPDKTLLDGVTVVKSVNEIYP